jgi:hypothetical protein
MSDDPNYPIANPHRIGEEIALSPNLSTSLDTGQFRGLRGGHGLSSKGCDNVQFLSHASHIFLI